MRARAIASVLALLVLPAFAEPATKDAPPTVAELQAQIAALKSQNAILATRLQIVQAQRNQALDADAVDGAAALKCGAKDK